MKNFKSQISNLKFLIVIPLLLFAYNASAELTARANHDHIKIDFFYHGSTVSITGVSDPKADLIIKITSAEGRQELKEKGKVGGMLWMNVKTLDLERVPNLYELYSTKNVSEILNQGEMEKYTIGYPALKEHIEMSPVADAAEKTRWFDEFVKYKEKSNLYSTNVGNIEMKNSEGKGNYYVLTPWPYQAPPGDYTVTVYAVKDKKVVETATAQVNVEQAGIVKSLAGMAKKSPSLYGIISILAALGAGFGVGLVFRKGGGAH